MLMRLSCDSSQASSRVTENILRLFSQPIYSDTLVTGKLTLFSGPAFHFSLYHSQKMTDGLFSSLILTFCTNPIFLCSLITPHISPLSCLVLCHSAEQDSTSWPRLLPAKPQQDTSHRLQQRLNQHDADREEWLLNAPRSASDVVLFYLYLYEQNCLSALVYQSTASS